MKNLLIKSLLLIWLFGPITVFAQEPLVPPVSNKNDAHQLFAGTGYGSNLIYYGTSISENQPYFSSELIYAWIGGLWAGAGFFHLPGEQPFVSFVDLSAGYSYVFSKVFDAGLAISQYHSSQSLDTTLFQNFTFLSANLGIDLKFLYSKITPGWLIADERNFYLLWDNSYYFNTPDLGPKGSFFSFNPTFSLMFGSYAYLSYFYYRYGGGGGGGQGPGHGGQGKALVEEHENFRLLDMQFSIPVAFYSGRFSLEAEPAYFINFIDDDNGDSSKRFFFTLGVYYKIF